MHELNSRWEAVPHSPERAGDHCMSTVVLVSWSCDRIFDRLWVTLKPLLVGLPDKMPCQAKHLIDCIVCCRASKSPIHQLKTRNRAVVYDCNRDGKRSDHDTSR